MPSRKSEDGTQRDIAHPITKEFRTRMETEILAEYKRVEERADHGEYVLDAPEKEEWAYVDDEL
jgi:DNA-binding cell septation regulator SpoVG